MEKCQIRDLIAKAAILLCGSFKEFYEKIVNDTSAPGSKQLHPIQVSQISFENEVCGVKWLHFYSKVLSK